MIETEQIETCEHLALFVNIELKKFYDRFISALNLPQMEFAYENETEWYEIEHNKIDYNISRPYKKGRLHEWDSSTPKTCNFGIFKLSQRFFY